VRFNPPPTWPPFAPGTEPTYPWQPTADLPPVPYGWQLWVAEEGETGEQPPSNHSWTFWIGAGIFLAGAISTWLSSGASGGFIWTGGLIFGVVLMIRGALEFRKRRQGGAPALGVVGKVGVAAALVLVVAAAGLAGTRFLQSENLSDGVGSCWVIEDDGSATLVPCIDAHDYKAVSEVDDPSQCPDDAYLEGDDGSALCIVED